MQASVARRAATAAEKGASPPSKKMTRQGSLTGDGGVPSTQHPPSAQATNVPSMPRSASQARMLNRTASRSSGMTPRTPRGVNRTKSNAELITPRGMAREQSSGVSTPKFFRGLAGKKSRQSANIAPLIAPTPGPSTSDDPSSARGSARGKAAFSRRSLSALSRPLALRKQSTPGSARGEGKHSWSEGWSTPGNWSQTDGLSGQELAKMWLNLEYEQMPLNEVLQAIRDGKDKEDWLVTPRAKETDLEVLVRCFPALLHNHAGLAAFVEFLVKQLGVENMMFYQAANQVKTYPTVDSVTTIYDRFINDSSDKMVNISGSLKDQLEAGMDRMNATGVVGRELIRSLIAAQKEIFQLMSDDLFSRFILAEDSLPWRNECMNAAEEFQTKNPTANKQPNLLLAEANNQGLRAIVEDNNTPAPAEDPSSPPPTDGVTQPPRFSDLPRRPSLKSGMSCGSLRSEKSVKWKREQAVVISPEDEEDEEGRPAMRSPEMPTLPSDISNLSESSADERPSSRNKKTSEFQRKVKNSVLHERFAAPADCAPRQSSDITSWSSSSDMGSSRDREEPKQPDYSRAKSVDSKRASIRQLSLRKSLHEIQMANPEDLKEVLVSNKHLASTVETLAGVVQDAPTEDPEPLTSATSTAVSDDELDQPLTARSASRIEQLRAKRAASIALLETPRSRRSLAKGPDALTSDNLATPTTPTTPSSMPSTPTTPTTPDSVATSEPPETPVERSDSNSSNEEAPAKSGPSSLANKLAKSKSRSMDKPTAAPSLAEKLAKSKAKSMDKATPAPAPATDATDAAVPETLASKLAKSKSKGSLKAAGGNSLAEQLRQRKQKS